MPLRRRDMIVADAVIGLLLVLALNSFRTRPVATPDSAVHRPLREALTRGEKREAVEQGCVVCHSATARPLPPKHPPKEQCLICHPWRQGPAP